jgi:hypothetical protein
MITSMATPLRSPIEARASARASRQQDGRRPPRTSLRLWTVGTGLVVTLAGCAGVSGAILESRDTKDLAVESCATCQDQFVRISGLSMHSALAVQRVETLREGGSLRVLVYMALAKEGASGRFNVEVPVPPGVDQVLLGGEGVLVWRRPST